MPYHPPKRTARAWLRYAARHTDQPVHTCRAPTPLERLAAHGYTRRTSEGLVWFVDGQGRETPARETLNAAVAAALESL